MKALFAVFAFLPLVLFAQTVTRLVPATNLYVPNGFDDNDNVEVIVSGFLPDSCYKAPSSSFKVLGNTIQITIKALYNNEGGACAEVIIPFIETVRLGALKAQNYAVSVESSNPVRMIKEVAVKKATASSIDDFSYAYVSGVRHMPGNRKVLIDAYSVSDCFKLKEVKVESNGIDTYAVLPIMEKINEFCPRKMTPLTIEAILPTTLNRKEILLHVRSMQGNSVNSIFYTQKK